MTNNEDTDDDNHPFQTNEIGNRGIVLGGDSAIF